MNDFAFFSLDVSSSSESYSGMNSPWRELGEGSTSDDSSSAASPQHSPMFTTWNEPPMLSLSSIQTDLPVFNNVASPFSLKKLTDTLDDTPVPVSLSTPVVVSAAPASVIPAPTVAPVVVVAPKRSKRKVSPVIHAVAVGNNKRRGRMNSTESRVRDTRRKKMHRQTDRERREKIKLGIGKLERFLVVNEALPARPGTKSAQADRATIVSTAADFMQSLVEENDRLRAQVAAMDSATF